MDRTHAVSSHYFLITLVKPTQVSHMIVVSVPCLTVYQAFNNMHHVVTADTMFGQGSSANSCDQGLIQNTPQMLQSTGRTARFDTNVQ